MTNTWSDLAEVIAERAQTLLWTPQGAGALDYLRGRGFVDDWIRHAELGFIPKYTEWHGLRIPPGISIPSRSDGVITQIRVRNPKPAPGKPKYLSVSGGKLRESLFGIDWINPNRGVIVFEGEFNALSCWQFGIAAVATTSAGNKIDQPAHMQKLLTVPWIMSWFDDDPAGDTARVNLPRCDHHIDFPSDLNDLAMLDQELAASVLLHRLKWVEADLPPTLCYLDAEMLADYRAECQQYWERWNYTQDAFEDAARPVTESEYFMMSLGRITTNRKPEVEQHTLFALPAPTHYSYGA